MRRSYRKTSRDHRPRDHHGRGYRYRRPYDMPDSEQFPLLPSYAYACGDMPDRD